MPPPLLDGGAGGIVRPAQSATFRGEKALSFSLQAAGETSTPTPPLDSGPVLTMLPPGGATHAGGGGRKVRRSRSAQSKLPGLQPNL